MTHATLPETDTDSPAPEHHGQAHPIRLYLLCWGLLFVLSAASYAVDYAQLQGPLRWTLILVFMGLKAGLILAVFMHMAWERLALSLAVLLPPLAALVFMGIMLVESGHTLQTRVDHFATE